MDVTCNETDNVNDIVPAVAHAPALAPAPVKKKKPKSSPLWNNNTHLVFVELCLNEARLGNKPGTTFNKAGYENLIKNIKERTGKDFTYKQLKNHWENMKKDWKLYDRLMRHESGIGWDPIRKTIDASPEWWDEKIKANEEFAKFRGQNLDIYKLYYDPLFQDIVAVGNRSKLSLEYKLVDEDEEHQEGKGDSDEMEKCDDEVQFFPACSSSSKRKKSSGSSRSTKGKTSVSSEFDEKLDSVINALSSRSTQSFPPRSSVPSTQDCMNIVTQFPGFEEGTDQYFEALKIFLKKEARGNFMVPSNNEAKMGFLKYMMEN